MLEALWFGAICTTISLAHASVRCHAATVTIASTLFTLVVSETDWILALVASEAREAVTDICVNALTLSRAHLLILTEYTVAVRIVRWIATGAILGKESLLALTVIWGSTVAMGRANRRVIGRPVEAHWNFTLWSNVAGEAIAIVLGDAETVSRAHTGRCGTNVETRGNGAIDTGPSILARTGVRCGTRATTEAHGTLIRVYAVTNSEFTFGTRVSLLARTLV